MPHWLDELNANVPFADAAQARKALEACLIALGRALPSSVAQALAKVLPEPFDAAALKGPHAQSLTTDEMAEQVAVAIGMGVGPAGEVLRIVCQYLGRHHVDDELLRRLGQNLPAELVEALHERPSSHPVAELQRAGVDDHTLARGQAGASNPISTAASGSGHPLHSAHPGGAQRSSVREANPHADTKLSSAKGLTQEREHETLADGRKK